MAARIRFLKRSAFMLAIALALTACAPQAAPEPDLAAVAMVTPAPIQIAEPAYASQTLIESGATTWRYLDESIQSFIPQTGTQWTEMGYDASGWKSASGSFGAKGGELAAMGKEKEFLPDILLNQYLPLSSKDVPAYFFRAEFTIANTRQIEMLQGTICYDDAVIVYLNGTPIYLGNVPEGGYADNFSYGARIGLGSPATAEFRLSAGLLKDGINVLAVELRQKDPKSSDIFFDFEELRTSRARINHVFLGVGVSPAEAMLCWSREDKLQTDAYVRVWSHEDPNAVKGFIVEPSTEANTNGYTYRAHITGLSPGYTYPYEIVCSDEIATGRITAAAAEDGVDILLIGDPQIHNGSEEDEARPLVKYLRWAERNVDYMFCLGDIAADSSNALAYQEAFRAMSNNVRMATVMGNHDKDTENYSDSVSLPNMTPLGATEGSGVMSGDYWFAIGKVLFLCLNSNSDDVTAHARFMTQAVADYTALYGAPEWKLAVMHHTLFSQGPNAKGSYTLHLRELLAPLFSRLDIDAVFSAHDHSYSRSYLMRGTESLPYTGNYAQKRPGETLYITLNSSTGSKFYDLLEERQNFIAFSHQSYRAMLTRLSVAGGNLRVWSYEPETNEVIDEFMLFRAEG